MVCTWLLMAVHGDRLPRLTLKAGRKEGHKPERRQPYGRASAVSRSGEARGRSEQIGRTEEAGERAGAAAREGGAEGGLSHGRIAAFCCIAACQ
jgi:hypothetical protein